MLTNARELRFRRAGMFTPLWTAMWALCTVYFLWRLYQMITGVLPWWLAFVPIVAIYYLWYMRLAAVKAVTVARDGSIVFDRYWGRREVHAIYVTRVFPWLGVSGKYFVLRHADGVELLFEDPEQTARVVQELKRLNPEIEVRGVPLLPGGV